MDTIKNGTVRENDGRTFPNKFKPGSYQQLLICQMQDGTEEKIYFDAGRHPHASLTPGSQIQIVYTTDFAGKKIRRLVPSSQPTPVSVAPVHDYNIGTHLPWDDSPMLQQQNGNGNGATKSIDEQILDSVEAMAFTYQKLKDMLRLLSPAEEPNEETLRSFTATIFIQLSKSGKIAISQESLKELLDKAKVEGEMLD